MKTLFTRVHAGPYLEDFEGDVAVLGLQEATIEGLNKLVDEARKVSKRLRYEATISAWDCPTIISTVAIENNIKSVKKCDKILEVIEKGGFIITDIPVDQVLALDEECEATECEQIHVDSHYMWWDFHPKYCDILCSTARVPVEKFAKKD